MDPVVAAGEAYQFLAPPRGDDEIGRLAHFRVLRLLGRGGMGMVFAAEDTSLERPVALKVMRPEIAALPEASARFLREARATAAIKHEHVITVYEAGEDRGVPYLAMELLGGISLQSWLHQGKAATLGQVVGIGLGIAKGLSAAHARDLIHRDIKPSNVWLEAPDGHVKILDFGLARVGQSGSGLTHAGAVLGTPAYMSPEQASGQAVDSRSDLFSLGCILYQLSTGRVPFSGQTVINVLSAIALQTAPPVRELNPAVPNGLASVIAKLLAKDPQKRPTSAREVVTDLEAIKRELAAAGHSFEMSFVSHGDSPVPASGSTLSFDKATPPAKPRPRSGLPLRRTILAASVAAFVVVIAAFIAFRPKPELRKWHYPNLEREASTWNVYVEGNPKWECTALEEPSGGSKPLRCLLAGGEPYSNAHFYRNLSSTGFDGSKRFTLSLSFRFSATTHNNEDGKSTIQALEFTTSQWLGKRRHEFALQWLNVGHGAPCWRYWDPHHTVDRWRDLAIPAPLKADEWHHLRLEGVVHNGEHFYERFAIDGQTHKLAISVPAEESDQPDKLAVGVQLDGNSLQDPYEVHLDKVSLTIDAK